MAGVQWLVAGVALFATGAACSQGTQPNYPVKSLKMIVPFPAGGPTDIVARLLGQKFSEAWGQQEDVIWDSIFGELGALALDPRPEVRNCAVNTLFSCVLGHGASFPLLGWEARIASPRRAPSGLSRGPWEGAGEGSMIVTAALARPRRS